MEVYLSATLLSILIYCLLYLVNRKRSTIKVFIALLPMIIISAIRYDVGWDYLKVYTNGFFMIGKGYIPNYFSEPIFCFIVKIIYNISKANVDWLFIICTIITFYFISKAINEQSVNVVFSILLVFLIRYYFLTLNIIRQGIAMSIILYSYKFLKEKDIKKYIFTILCASCFHMMSLIYLPVYFLYKIDWKKKKNSIMAIVIPFLALIVYFAVIKYTKFGLYIGSKFQTNEFLIHEIILSFAILVLATFEIKNVKHEKEYFNVYYILQIITFFIAILSKFLPVADRIVWLFYVQNIFFIPLIVKNISDVNKKAFITLIILIITGINVYAQVVMTDSYNIVPYKTIFNK